MSVEVPAEATAHVLDTSAAGGAAIRGSAWRISGYLFGLLFAVASSAILFRHLGRTDAGRYTLAMSLVTIVAGLSDLGLTALGVRELSVRSGDSRARFARNLLGMRIVVTVLGVTVVALFAAGVGDGETLVLGVVIAGAGLLLQTCQSTLSAGLISELRFGWLAMLDFLRAFLTAGLIVVLALLGARLIPFLAIGIPVGALLLAMNAVVLHGRMPLVPAFHPNEWRRLIGSALPYTLAAAAATIYTQMAVVVVSLTTTKGALGDFSVSARAMQMLVILPALAAGTALPIFARAARDDRERLAYALRRVFEVTLILGAGTTLALAVGAPLAVNIYGAAFSRAVPLVAIQGVGLGATFVGTVWANGLVSLGRYRAILVINLSTLASGTALIVVLASVDGARGAAIATSVVEGVVVLLSGAALARTDGSLKPSLRIVPTVGAAGALGALTTLLPLPVVASLLVAIALYAAVIVLAGAVPPELRQELRWRRSNTPQRT